MGRSWVIRAIALASALLLGGCAIAPEFTDTTAHGTTVNVDKVYVYSFIDLRSEELGPQLMAEIEKQLGDGLRAVGIESRQHWLKRDPIALEMAFKRAPGQSTAWIPVREIIARNAVSERAFGARYRLVVFPSSTTTSGAWRFYDFTWALEESSSGRPVWTTKSQSKHLVFWTAGENATERAQLLIDGVLVEMSEAGVFGHSVAP